MPQRNRSLWQGRLRRQRKIHGGDATGLAIMNGLVAALADYPNIEIKSEATAVNLITFPHHSPNPLDNYREVSCHGCYVFDGSEKTVHRYLAKATILATGGLEGFTEIRQTRSGRAAMVWRWPIAPEQESRTPNTFSFIRQLWPLRAPKGC